MNYFSFSNLKFIHLIALVGYLFWPIQSADAQSCQAFKLSAESIERWYNPHPSSSDFKLPMPLGMALVFSPIPLGTQSLYGDEKLTYVMGSTKPALFETNLQVRVGSSISPDGESQLLFGKYEVSKAQYVAVMGNGVLDRGVRVLAEKSRDPNARQVLSKFISGRCKGVFTKELYDFLSEPLTFLSYRDYIEFLDTYNAYCISRNNCRSRLSRLGPNRDVPGFVRLPAEHEWEFVARGGQEFVAGTLSHAEFQNDLPASQTDKTITDYAHVGSDPPRLLPIGSRKPLFGIYDMLGNAQELMVDQFTSENGFGAVGAYVARGGHFRLTPKELRVTKRVELQAFRLDDSTNSFVVQYFPLTGIRMVIGYPVVGKAQRLGDYRSIQQDFEENYEIPGEAGDKAGDTLSDAYDLGVVGEKDISVSEKLSRDDVVDYYKVSLRNYSTIIVNMSSNVSMLYEVTDESQDTVYQGMFRANAQRSPALLPGDYWIKLTPVNSLTMEERYRFVVSRSLIADTGIEKLDPVELRNAQSIGSSKRELIHAGYVGTGDTVDIYPIRDASRIGGIELELDELTAPVELTYVDDKLNVVRSFETGLTGEKTAVVFNSDYGHSGFVQISASSNAATTYKLKISSKEPYDKVFVKKAGSTVGSSSSENVHYEGNLDPSLPVLYLPIQIDEPKILKVELTNLSADVDLRVLNSNKLDLESLHSRKDSSPEFFSKWVDSGIYFAEVQLKSTRAFSRFKLLYTTEKLPSNAYISNTTSRSDSINVPSAATNNHTAKVNSTNNTTALSDSVRFLGNLDRKEIERRIVLRTAKSYYRFVNQGASKTIKVLLVNPFRFNSKYPDLYLEDDHGTVLARGRINSQNASELKATLKQGTYYLRLERHRNTTLVKFYNVSISTEFTTTMVKAFSAKDPDFSQFGTLVGWSGNFKIYRIGNWCTLVTVAKQFSPISGWRSTKPYFYIRVKNNSDRIVVSMDYTEPETKGDLYQANSVQAKVPVYGEISTSWHANILQPTSYRGGFTVSSRNWSRESRRRLIQGSSLIINGRTPNNRVTRIEYSLSGYRNAVQRINELCSANADWIWLF